MKIQTRRYKGIKIDKTVGAILFIVIALFVLVAVSRQTARQQNDGGLQLRLVDRIDIEDKENGLREPSGLALSAQKDALWTVSDNAHKIYKLGLDGKLQPESTIELADPGLEGIALEPAGRFLYTVNEDANEIIQVHLSEKTVLKHKALAGMQEFSAVAKHFEDSPPNKGLEGITWNRDSGSIFVLKESAPGLLIEVSHDLERLLDHVILSEANGFFDDDTDAGKLDFSGIVYDPVRKQFWIVSDKGQRLFLYDRQRNEVVASLALAYQHKNKEREIKKAEGVAIDPAINRLFVVSDKEARLYIYDILR